MCKTGKRNRKKWGEEQNAEGGWGTRLDLISSELTWEILTTQEAVNLRTSFKCQRHKLIYLIRKICLYCTLSNFPQENWLSLQLKLLYNTISPHSPCTSKAHVHTTLAGMTVVNLHVNTKLARVCCYSLSTEIEMNEPRNSIAHEESLSNKVKVFSVAHNTTE